jgi:hypothetical protein
MRWLRHSRLPEANVDADWIDHEHWRHWGAPSNHIAGEASYLRALTDLVGGPCDGGYCVFTPVTFRREPGNRHDANAVRADVHGVCVGYLRRQIAAQVSPKLDRVRCRDFIVCGVIRGGATRASNLGVHVWLGRRLGPGPAITISDDPWPAPWPPRGDEASTFRVA